MLDYDFRVLHDKEFEALANDLLSRRESKPVDRYKPGKDGGVDGVFFEVDGCETIIQSKHWARTGLTKLRRHLVEKELPKIKKIDPSRYILVTSVELSRKNKKDLINDLSPHIKSELDILGKENLNDLLTSYSDIEKNHYKLWLSSTNVLETLINAAISGRSKAKGMEIVEDSKKYVITSNHERALQTLNDTHTVIITGEAGIGKTTLADQLAHYFMAKGFELCVFEDDISEAEAVFEDESKKVFYFDDFLGRNYLMALEGRKDSRILNFIERVRKDKNKRFILTSRSTVLNQAKSLSDLYNIKKIDRKEYEIKISSLTNLERARILYNHIWYGDLDDAYIDEFYADRRYVQVAKHRNFNPRLISFITDSTRVEEIGPNEYWSYIEETLDNPKGVWEHVFDEQIDELARLAVCLVVFNGSRIAESEFQSCLIARAIRDGLVKPTDANRDYNRLLKSSIGSVLTRQIGGEDSNSKISLFNPSVADFVLARYIDDQNSLKTFFLSLDTESSLENLDSLRQNSGLKSEVYHSILQELSRSKLNVSQLNSNPNYTLLLAAKAFRADKWQNPNIASSIVEIAHAVSSVSFSKRHLDKVYAVFKFSLKDAATRELLAGVIDFVESSLLDGLDHDELVEIHSIADLIDEYELDDLDSPIEDVKSAISKYWKSELAQKVEEDLVLEEYTELKQADRAYEELFEYLEDKLFMLDFTSEEIENLLGYTDIEEHIRNNREAMFQDDSDEQFRGPRGDLESKDDDSEIDALFYRGN